ncbi:MAG: hypothetical protein IIC78_06595 [Chloroflexi bacterium]|nr:hypothetical protein [Chloroflexota bacterium]
MSNWLLIIPLFVRPVYLRPLCPWRPQFGLKRVHKFHSVHTYYPRTTPGKIENIIADLLEYCKLDTLAMVKNWEAVNKIVTRVD